VLQLGYKVGIAGRSAWLKRSVSLVAVHFTGKWAQNMRIKTNSRESWAICGEQIDLDSIILS
jgi:hypothetical protein